MDKQGDIRALVALSSAMLTVAMGVGFVVPLLSLFADTLGAGGLWMGLIVGANPAIRATFMPYVGYLSDIRGKKRYLLTGLCGYIVVAALMGLAVSPWQLFLARALQGFFSSMVMPVSQAYAGVLFVPSSLAIAVVEGRRVGMGSTMGIIEMASGIGMAAGAVLGGAATQTLGLTYSFFVIGGVALSGAIPFQYLLRTYREERVAA